MVLKVLLFPGCGGRWTMCSARGALPGVRLVEAKSGARFCCDAAADGAASA